MALTEHQPVVARLEAADGGVDIANARLLLFTSKLLRSLPPAQHVHVPFSKQEVEGWRDFLVNSDRSFSNCVAALKVADFLQDEETLASATAQANAILMNSGRKRSAGCMEAMEALSMVATQHVEGLLSLYALQPQLAINILREDVSQLQKREWVYFWLHRLPGCFRPLIVASVVEDSCLEVHNYRRIPDPEDFFLVVQALQPPLEKLVIDRATVDGRKVAARIAPLAQLRCLELLSCYPPFVPPTLTALTRLRLENASSYCYSDETTSFTGDLSVFSALQELELNCVHIPDFERLTSQLTLLTSLSSLTFKYRNLRMSEAGSLKLALSALPLASLTLHSLPDHNHVSGFNDGDAWDILFRACLTCVTRLDVAGSATETLMFVWDAMPQLQHVTLEDVDLRTPALFGQSHIAIECLKHLQHLSAKHLPLTKQGAVQLLVDLPCNLTALLLDGTSFCDASAPALAALCNLRQLSLSQRADPNGAVGADVPLTCAFSAGAVHHAFGALTALQHLDMHRCCMPDETTVAVLSVLPACMTGLDISKNQFPARAAPLVARLTKLQRLSIGFKYESLTNDVAVALAQHITALSELRFFDAEWHPSPQVSADACVAMVCSLRVLPHLSKTAAKYFEHSLHVWWPGVATRVV